MKPTLCLLISLGLMLAGCADRKADQRADQKADQDTVCQASTLEPPTSCKPGQKVAFLPKTWGNPQVPVLFAGMNCDLTYSVVVTEGAVTCIYRPVKTAVSEQAGASPEKGSSARQ